MLSSPTDVNSPIPGASHVGDLARGDTTWKVLLQIQSDIHPIKGRIHFVTEGAHRSTGWIFVEPTEQDVVRRFGDFSALELWRLLESLA